jgi:formylglycine-generating enzyme required for sulfatase activity
MQICIFLIPSRKSTRAAATNISVIRAIFIGFQSLVFLSIANADERLTLTQSDVVAGSDTPASTLPVPVLGPKLGDYILLSGGEMLMGSQSSWEPDEKPEHKVSLKSFYIGRTPVTNREFVRFLNGDKLKPWEFISSQLPVERRSISFHDGEWVCSEELECDACSCESWLLADRFCRWLTLTSGKVCRLPTEAEWEFACRGSEGRKFPWGEETNGMADRAWLWRTWSSHRPGKIAVASFPMGATPEGVCDLIGYMDECCSDWYSPEYYEISPADNPKGPTEPSKQREKVVRGGLAHDYQGLFHRSQYFGVLPSCYVPMGWTRNEIVDAIAPPPDASHVYDRLGFRVVVEVEE